MYLRITRQSLCAVITFSRRRDRRVAVILQYLSGQVGTGDFVRNEYNIVDSRFATFHAILEN